MSFPPLELPQLPWPASQSVTQSLSQPVEPVIEVVGRVVEAEPIVVESVPAVAPPPPAEVEPVLPRNPDEELIEQHFDTWMYEEPGNG